MKLFVTSDGLNSPELGEIINDETDFHSEYDNDSCYLEVESSDDANATKKALDTQLSELGFTVNFELEFPEISLEKGVVNIRESQTEIEIIFTPKKLKLTAKMDMENNILRLIGSRIECEKYCILRGLRYAKRIESFNENICVLALRNHFSDLDRTPAGIPIVSQEIINILSQNE